MRKLITLVMTLVLLLVAAFPASAQKKKQRSWFGRKSRTVAIVAGGAALGAVTGGIGTAALLGGGAGLFAFNRRAAQRHFQPSTRRWGTVASAMAMGGGAGRIVGGRTATAIGAAAGGVGSYVYMRTRPQRRRY